MSTPSEISEPRSRKNDARRATPVVVSATATTFAQSSAFLATVGLTTLIACACNNSSSLASPPIRVDAAATVTLRREATPIRESATELSSQSVEAETWSNVEPSKVLFPVNYCNVVVKRGIQGVRLRGAAKIVSEPDDHDDTYLVRRDVEEDSVPAQLRELRGKTATVYHLDGSTCRSQLGRVSAFGWLMSVGNLDHLAESKRQRKIVETAMSKGTTFLAAELDSKDCNSGMWATLDPSAPLRFEASQLTLPELKSRALAEIRTTPAYIAHQESYTKFRIAEDARVARIRANKQPTDSQWLGPPYPREGPLSKGPPFPIDWTEFHASSRGWTIGESSRLQLLVAFLRSEGGAFGFSRSQVAVFRVHADPTWKLTFMGPLDGGTTDWYDFRLLAALNNAAGLPLLLYSTITDIGALRPVHGQYVVDTKLNFGPAAL